MPSLLFAILCLISCLSFSLLRPSCVRVWRTLVPGCSAASYEEYESVVGARGQLPCNSSHWKSSVGGGSGEGTPISLVLWFKEGSPSNTPIYTLDVRNQVSLSRSRHIPSPAMKDRAAKFDLSLSPPRLVIRNISKSDEGLFRCRVRVLPPLARAPVCAPLSSVCAG